MDKIVTHLYVCLLATFVRSETAFSGTSSIVFPVVYEQRNDASQKVLVIHEGYSLNLVKASVLSDRVLLRVATESGFTERYSGLLNLTHRIEPLYSQERSSSNRAAHRISKVAFNGGTLDASASIGVAYLGQACASYKLGIGEDYPDLFSGVHTAVHELGHLLSSPHDGEGASSSCHPKDGYVMSPSGTGMNVFSFSSCSQRAILRFLWSGRSYCLEDHDYANHIALLPNKTMKLPGQIMNGTKYCKRYFPGHPNVTYVKWDSDLKKCKFRCSLFVKANGEHKYAIRYAFDGTPCNRSRPTMVSYPLSLMYRQ
ncbi:hypothetical protein HPB50_002202 [Hyalomma asiaticum]|uniref:Uncharacterized protein n=1 Tax=Hyalomma asiaticum TaxID=266040 RepID=A0ACB7RLN9_HYAAI|nr:hypothetical protein HPB50_002202 [Hyalomma asiaticum]